LLDRGDMLPSLDDLGEALDDIEAE